MRWSLNLGRIAGIKVFIHWTFLILIAWLVFHQLRLGKSWEEVVITVVFIFAVFGCVVLHELGHALMARKFDIQTRDITLLPIGGLARLEKIPVQPKQELWVALAGPVVNLVISGFLLLYFALNKSETLTWDLFDPEKAGIYTFMANLLAVNVFIAVFNLIPAFPMDGGRVLRALLAFQYNRVNATRLAVALGQIIAIGFAFIGLIYNPILLLIAIFVYLGAQFELEQVQSKALLKDYQVSDVMMRQFHKLESTDPLIKAVTQMLDSQDKDFVVLDGGRVTGLLTSQHIITGLKNHQGNKPIGEVMSAEFRQLDPGEPLDKVFEEFQLKRYSILPVVKREQLIGVLNLENIAEFIAIQNALTTDGNAAKYLPSEARQKNI